MIMKYEAGNMMTWTDFETLEAAKAYVETLGTDGSITVLDTGKVVWFVNGEWSA